jgi:hypothetical protein
MSHVIVRSRGRVSQGQTGVLQIISRRRRGGRSRLSTRGDTDLGGGKRGGVRGGVGEDFIIGNRSSMCSSGKGRMDPRANSGMESG